MLPRLQKLFYILSITVLASCKPGGKIHIEEEIATNLISMESSSEAKETLVLHYSLVPASNLKDSIAAIEGITNLDEAIKDNKIIAVKGNTARINLAETKSWSLNANSGEITIDNETTTLSRIAEFNPSFKGPFEDADQ